MEIPTVSHVLRLLIKGTDRGSSAILAVFAAEARLWLQAGVWRPLATQSSGWIKKGLTSTRA
jgi:hypothetical protein